MTEFRPGHFLVSLAFVSLCSACAGTGTQGEMTEAERLDKIAAARQDRRDASMRWNMLVARRAAAEGRWSSVYQVAQTMFDADYEKAESGHLLGKALGNLGNPAEQVAVYRKVRKLDVDLVSDDEFLDALVAALNGVGYNDVNERLALRLEIARVSPEHPSASNMMIHSDMLALTDIYYREGKWEAMLGLIQAVAASPLTLRRRGQVDGNRVDYLYAVALWKNDRKAEAFRKFEEYLAAQHAASTPVRRLRKVARFFQAEGHNARAIELYERSLGNLSSVTTPQQVNLYLDLARRLLSTGEPDDRERGKAYLLYYLDLALQNVSEHQRASVYGTVRRVALRHHMTQLAQELTQQAVATGAASHHLIERLFKDTMRGGDKKRARKLLEDYLKNSNRDSAIWNVADWSREVGEYELAYRYMKRAVAKSPERDNWWYDLAQISLALGKKKEAVAALEEYLASERTNNWDVQSAARFLQQAGMNAEAIAVLDGYRAAHPNDTPTIRFLADIMRNNGQRKQALKMLKEMAATDGISRDQLMNMAHYVSRTFGKKDAYELYLAAGERGDHAGFVEAASIAVSNGQMATYDAIVQNFVGASTPRFHELERLWHVVRSTDDKNRQVWLLERMLAASSHRGGRYRGLLTRLYFEMGHDKKALALWDDSKHRELRSHLFQSVYLEFSAPGLRAKFLEQFRGSYPDGKASAWMLFLAGEQHYGRFGEESRIHGADSQEAQSHHARARAYYTGALEKSSGRSSLYRTAAHFFEQRKMLDLAEQSLVNLLNRYSGESASWFDYAEFLLEQGRADAAEQVFLRYVQEMRAKEDAILTVARTFQNFNRDDKAEAFYKMAVVYHQNSTRDALVHRRLLEGVGAGLGTIYLKSGRIDEFLDLTSDYYVKYLGQHKYLRPHDRSIDLKGLRQRGLWKEYVARVERLPETDDHHARKESLAQALWYMGRHNAAWELFNEHLGDDRYDTGHQWLQLAEFLEHRGGETFAATAYDRAVRKSSQYRRYSALMARAKFLIKQGHYEAAIQDFFRAAKSTNYGPSVAGEMFSAFQKAGRQNLAVQATRREESPFSHKTSAAGRVDQLSEVGSSEPAEVVEYAKKLAKQGAIWDELFTELEEMGHYAVIATLIEERLQARDINVATELVLTYADELASIDRLDPLVERIEGHRFNIREQGLNAFLVDHYLQNGQHRRALDILARTRPSAGASVTSLQLSLGDEEGFLQSATEQFTGSIRSSYSRRQLLPVVDFMRFGDTALYSTITERLAQLDVKSRKLEHTYIADLVHRGSARAAIAYLRRTAEALADGDKSRRYSARATFIGGMSLLAASGYVAEVRGLIEELPERVREQSSILKFTERLSEVYDEVPPEGDEEARDEGAQPQGQEWSHFLVHDRVRELLLDGRYDEAEGLILDALDTSNGRASQRRYKLNSGTNDEERLLRQLLGVYATRADSEGLERGIELWKKRLGQDNDAIERLIEALDSYGLEAEAAQVARESAEIYRTGDLLEKAIVAAAHLGDRHTIEALLPFYWRQIGMLGRSLGENGIHYTVMQVDPQVAGLLLAPYLKAIPDDPRIRRSEILVALRAGDVERGRMLTRQYIGDFAEAGSAVVRLARALNDNDFDVESARVVAPKLAVENISTEMGRELAEACAHIGRYEDAKRYLNGVVDKVPAAELTAARLSYQYTIAGHLELGRAMADRAFAEGGTLGQSYLARGVWRLASGKSRAEEDIERGLRRRQADVQTLSEVATLALRAERLDVAEVYLERLVRIPALTGRSWAHPLRVAIDTVIEADQARWGVEFFDREVPGFLDAPYLIAQDQWTSAIGLLLTEAGMRERADRWYVRAQDYMYLTGSGDRDLHELLNARALNLAINGGDAQEALQLSRRAVAASTHRRSAYLLTMALAYKSAGDDNAAKNALARASKRDAHLSRLMRERDDLLEVMLSEGVGVFRKGRRSRYTWLGPPKLYDKYQYNRARGHGFSHGSRHRQPQQPTKIYRGTSP